MTPNIKSGQRARSDRFLKQLAERIIRKCQPQKIILFGSYAYGHPKKDSDIDLLVVLEKPEDRHERYVKVDKAIGEHILPLDLIVRSPKEIKERLKIGDWFFMEVMKKGFPLYDRQIRS